MKIETTVRCPIHDSFRVRQVAGLMDVPIEQRAEQSWSVDVPTLDEPWQIGAIVGPSGSGKSTIARAAFGDRLFAGGNWPANQALIDGFPDVSIKEITALLTAVGFSQPPAWLKPYAVLSNGQKFRADLALSLLQQPTPAKNGKKTNDSELPNTPRMATHGSIATITRTNSAKGSSSTMA